MKIEAGKMYECKLEDAFSNLPLGCIVKVTKIHGGSFVFQKVEDRKEEYDWDEGSFKRHFKKWDSELVSSKPAHYDSEIDTIAFAKANFPPEQVKGFFRINAIKYLQRYDLKDGVKDLKKARHYLDMLIELEEQANGG